MENKYLPLTEEESTKLIDILSKINDRLPEHDAPFIWNMFNKVRDAREPQPCTCASSGAHWGRAVGELREWIKQRA